MFESLFGTEMPLAVRFFIAFIVVLVLIGLTAWLVRRFGTSRLGDGTRGRQPRLAVIEAGAVDGRRRLVLIRRDNVEHLLMIGGPSDIVVEQNIVRGQASGREVATARGAGIVDTPSRAIPLAEPTAWPLQPEVALRPSRQAMPEETMHWSLQPEPAPMPAPAPRRARTDTLAGLAAELSRPETPAEPALTNGRSMPAPEPVRHTAPAAETPPGADQNLADMAQRLEAALRQTAPAQGRNGAKATAPTRPAMVTKLPETSPPARSDIRHPVTEQATTDQSKKAFSSLEQEMANLLGRQPGKT
jgi:flagellar protein FliO/FliZ